MDFNKTITGGSLSLFLLSTDGCHLCHEAEGLLQQLAIDYELVDIIEDAHLVELYGDKIPVLIFEGAEQALFWPFETQQIEQYLIYYGINPSK